MNGTPILAASYDCRLIVLSLAVAILASHVALEFAERIAASRGPVRYAWLTGGAFGAGIGMWTMHFTSMLACHFSLPVFYHVPTLLFSLAASILACMAALYVSTLEQVTARHILAGSALLGVGLAVAHRMGMAAIRVSGVELQHETPWLISILQAVVLMAVGALVISHSRRPERSGKSRCSVALLMGLAVSATHYTGMSAVTLAHTGTIRELANAVNISEPTSVSVGFATTLLLILASIISVAGRRHSARHTLLDDELNMLRSLVDNIPDFVFVKDTESRWIVVNSHLARVLCGGKTPKDVQGKTDSDFFPPEVSNAIYADDLKIIRTGQPLYNREETLVDEPGNEIHLLTTKVPLFDSKGKVIGIAGIGRDISARKKMEDALREAEQKYRGIFDNAIIGMFQSTPEGRFLSVNPAMAKIFGYESPEEMITLVTDIARQCYCNSERRREFLALMHNFGGVHNLDGEAIRKDGRTIWVSLSVRATYREGVLIRYEGMCEDITERNLLRAQLLQAQKLESVGQLAAGIAHEINTPTQYIGDNVRFLRDSFTDIATLLGQYRSMISAARDNPPASESLRAAEAELERVDIGFLLEEIPRALDQTLEGVSRVATLVIAMKEFSHPGTKEKIPVDLNHAIESTITVARNEWKYVAEMETNFDHSLPLIPCLPADFNQVILNLIVNAAHAIADVVERDGGGKGKITVETHNYPEWAEIRIQDTGTGIPEKIRTRIFDPFFTTKEIGKGTGQGLAIARSVVVDKHGGTLHFETEVGHGTTFVIHLPLDGKPLSGIPVAA